MSNENETNKVGEALLNFISAVPKSSRTKSENPAHDVDDIISSATWKAAGVSGTLAIPPGPLGLVTILPDLVIIWKIQSQMVADIAATYGRSANLKQEAMLYCLFKHGSSHLFRDIFVRVGERLVVKRASLRLLQQLCAKIGLKITQRLLGKSITRWIPIIGAIGVAWYAKYDTAEIGKTAKELFSEDFAEEISSAS